MPATRAPGSPPAGPPAPSGAPPPGPPSSATAIPAYPTYYDYGSNVVYQDDGVYMDGTMVATAPQYAEQRCRTPTPAGPPW